MITVGMRSPTVSGRCSGCKRARYCGAECQKGDWARHKAECRAWRAEADAAVIAAGGCPLGDVEAQKAAFKAGAPCPPYPEISDAEIRETIDANQLRLIKERGADMTIFSPRASAMAPLPVPRSMTRSSAAFADTAASTASTFSSSNGRFALAASWRSRSLRA